MILGFRKAFQSDTILLSMWALLAFSFFLLQWSCAPGLRAHFLQAEEIRHIPSEFEEIGSAQKNLSIRGRGPCYDYNSYLPDTNHLDHSPVKYVRINLHWMQAEGARSDFPEQKVREFSKGLVKAANYALNNNKPMWLPHNNDTPTLPIRIQYVLTPRSNDTADDGIYFHYDDEQYFYVAKGKHRNLYNREVVNKYGAKLDTVLNIFFMPHHPDSIRSKSYTAARTGVALGNTIKLAGVDYNGDYWAYRGLFNHEVGHIYGLSHTWAYNDGCDDTPRHEQNCWNRSQPGCDTTTSNNVMDYNALQLAWTPCQIGKVQQRMADLRTKARQFVVPTWCRLDTEKTIVIRDTIAWEGAKDLEGNLYIASSGYLRLNCRLSVPPGGKITIEPGGVLLLDDAKLHNACGQQWQGIEILESKDGERGQVQIERASTFEDMQNAVEFPAGGNNP